MPILINQADGSEIDSNLSKSTREWFSNLVLNGRGAGSFGGANKLIIICFELMNRSCYSWENFPRSRGRSILNVRLGERIDVGLLTGECWLELMYFIGRLRSLLEFRSHIRYIHRTGCSYTANAKRTYQQTTGASTGPIPLATFSGPDCAHHWVRAGSCSVDENSLRRPA